MLQSGGEKIINPLAALKGDLTALVRTLHFETPFDMEEWQRMVEQKLLTRLSATFPIMAAICGGGSSGKSTLFNTLAGENLSPMGGRSGMNRRVLLAGHGDIFKQDAVVSELFEPFHSRPSPLQDPEQLTRPGPPVYKATAHIPPRLVLMDTPDFDTGAKGQYTNREAARQALEACDFLIYIFTNSNYNNRDNTDFIAHMLTGIGLRRCFLVYRVYPSFSQEEVLEHANTVARNIYGANNDQAILGIYRIDEDNAVAAGKQTAHIHPVKARHEDLKTALTRLDHRKLREDLISSILTEVLEQGQQVIHEGQASQDMLDLYIGALQYLQSQCVQKALLRFPMDQLMGRFASIWMATDPAHIRAMRKTGSVLAYPVKLVTGAARWFKKRQQTSLPPSQAPDFQAQLQHDLVDAASQLHFHAVSAELSGVCPEASSLAEKLSNHEVRQGADKQSPIRKALQVENLPQKRRISFRLDAHPVVHPVQQHLRRLKWETTAAAILAQQDSIVALSESIELELRRLADQFRSQMGLMDKVTQTFSAFLNVLPATVAVTYILHTGDPVGATGIKVKLGGLLGLNDLYALVAIPATSGLKKADRKQLETLLKPIAQAWFKSKLETVDTLFRAHITEDLFAVGQQAHADATQLIERLQAALNACRKTLKQK